MSRAHRATAAPTLPQRRATSLPSVTNRTRVGNGKQLFLDGDERGPVARRFREVLAQLIDDCGGVENVTEAQTAIARRATMLIIWAESVEAEVAQGKALDVASYATAANSLRRLLADLGLERRQRDVTPSVDQYIRTHYGSAEAEHDSR